MREMRTGGCQWQGVSYPHGVRARSHAPRQPRLYRRGIVPANDVSLSLLPSLVSYRGVVRRSALALAACVWMSGAAHAQQGTSIATPDHTQRMPDAQGFPSAPVPVSPGVSGGMRLYGVNPLGEDAPRFQRPKTDDTHFAWGQFVTDATRAGVRFAVPQLSQRGSEGLVGDSSFMGGSFAGQSSNGGMASGGVRGSGGMRGGGMQGGGRNSLMDVGSGLLRSLGDSTDGALGMTLHALSSLTNSRSGYALSTAGTGVDFHVSGSMGNMMGGSTPGGGGLGTAGHGAAGHSSGPSLSLKLKF